MSRPRSKLFRSKRKKVVRLPKTVELPPTVREVEITVLGTLRVIAPGRQSWRAFFGGPVVTHDFVTQLRRPAMQKRKGPGKPPEARGRRHIARSTPLRRKLRGL